MTCTQSAKSTIPDKRKWKWTYEIRWTEVAFWGTNFQMRGLQNAQPEILNKYVPSGIFYRWFTSVKIMGV